MQNRYIYDPRKSQQPSITDTMFNTCGLAQNTTVSALETEELTGTKFLTTQYNRLTAARP